jgi:hypothetical protein
MKVETGGSRTQSSGGPTGLAIIPRLHRVDRRRTLWSRLELATMKSLALITALILVLTSNLAYARNPHKPTPTPFAAPTMTATPRQTNTAIPTPVPTNTAIPTRVPTNTATATPARTATPAITPTPVGTPVVFKILSPPDGSTLSGVATVNVQVPTGIAVFNAFADQTYLLSVQAPTSPTAFQFDTTWLQSGVLHNLALFPYDPKCNALNTANITFNVGAPTSPTPVPTPTPNASVTITQPIDGAIESGPFTVSFQETGTDIHLTNVFIDGVYLQSSPPSATTFVLNTSALQTGELHSITVKAYDVNCFAVAAASAAFTLR